METRTEEAGFTIVEVVVTMVVLSIFLFGFFQTYFALEAQRITVAKQARAGDLAYTNLLKVTHRPSQLTASVCADNADIMDLTTGNPTSKTGLDITIYGYDLEPDAEVEQLLGPDVTQTLVAFAPAGCADLDTSPVKIVSTVTFGADEDRATHAVYVQ